MDCVISCSGNGKNEVDSINGVDKNTILRKSMRKLVDASIALESDSKALKPHTYEVAGGKRYSAAADCKRILELEGSEGVKSEGNKRAKRERNRGIRNRYWHVRGVQEELSNVKCSTITNFSKTATFRDIYHYYTCPELGAGFAALRRLPCNCNACNETIIKPWIPGVAAKEQPRFTDPEDCYFKSVMGDHNCWHIVEVKPGADTDEKDLGDLYEDALHNIASALSESIEIGNVGAVSTSDPKADYGYYLVEFAGLPFTEQDGTGALKCDCYFLYSLPNANHWYYRSKVPYTAALTNVVAASVDMHPMSPSNMVPAVARRSLQSEGLVAEKISLDSHLKVIDECRARDFIEFDPSRVYTGAHTEYESDGEAD